MKETDLDFFEKAYQNKLNEKELIQFEARIQSDFEFRNSYHEFKKSMEWLDVLHFKNNLTSTIEKHEKRIGKKTPSTLWLIPIAALAIFGLFFLTKNDTHNWNLSEDLIPLPDLYTKRQIQQLDIENRLQNALTQYNLKNYKKSAELFSPIANNDTTSIYLAVSYILSGNCEMAIPILEKVRTPIFNNEKNYYLGASQYCLKNFHKASDYWNKISKPSTYLQTIPDQLLDE